MYLFTEANSISHNFSTPDTVYIKIVFNLGVIFLFDPIYMLYPLGDNILKFRSSYTQEMYIKTQSLDAR